MLLVLTHLKYVSMRALRDSSRRDWTHWLVLSSVPISEKLFIGELNEHVGSTRVGFDGVHEGFRYGSRNQEGEGILNFALAYDLIVMNIIFKKSLSSSNF
jgi:hypothetical protein